MHLKWIKLKHCSQLILSLNRPITRRREFKLRSDEQIFRLTFPSHDMKFSYYVTLTTILK